MKNFILLLLFTFISLPTVFSQEEGKNKDQFEYPFGETGKPISRGVYGSDDRKEVNDAEGIEDFVRATAVMIPRSNIRGNRVYGYSLRERLSRKFGTSNFDKNIKFLDQPTCASCTGFLIAPDILVTAAHCIKNMEKAKDYVWIFDYTNELDYYPNRKYIEVDLLNMFEVKEIIEAHYDGDEDIDYSFLKLDRKSSRAPYRFRTSGKVQLSSRVATIGSPTGLPLKYADNAVVVDNSPTKWFKNSIDTFPGNSGGPVFSPEGFIEGIHVRGAVQEQGDGSYKGDYKYDEYCDCIKTVNWTSTRYNAGAQAHRISSVPYNVLHTAIYENIEYAIQNRLPNRLKSWSIYSWIFDHNYTVEKGKFELLAASSNNFEALKFILEKTSNLVFDSNGRNLLFYAIDNNNLIMTEYLLDKGVSVNTPDNMKQDAMFYSLHSGELEIIRLLLSKYEDFDKIDTNGNNLLHLAAILGDFPIVKDLVKNGVNAGIRNNAKKRPENISKKNKKIRKYLKKARKGRL